jgi:hypothetical protein
MRPVESDQVEAKYRLAQCSNHMDEGLFLSATTVNEHPRSNLTLNIFQSLQDSFSPAQRVRARFVLGIKNRKKDKSLFTLVDYTEFLVLWSFLRQFMRIQRG